MGTYNGKRGDDILRGSKRDDFMNGKEGNDTLYGGSGNDTMYGWYGNDVLYGEAGNDRLYGDWGDDILDGGAGNDSLDGGDGADTLIGGDGDDTLGGFAGDDTLDGGAGHDELVGGSGLDRLTGGADDDWFIFLHQADSVGAGDVITDFQPGVDQLVVGYYGNVWDANASADGLQKWEYVGSDPIAALANGNGQATITYVDGFTVLRLFNNDGDDQADFTLNLQGIYQPEELQISTFEAVVNSTVVYTDGIIFGG